MIKKAIISNTILVSHALRESQSDTDVICSYVAIVAKCGKSGYCYRWRITSVTTRVTKKTFWIQGVSSTGYWLLMKVKNNNTLREILVIFSGYIFTHY